MKYTPCLNCVPPKRKPGCCCQEKKDWDAAQAEIQKKKRSDADMKSYCALNAQRVFDRMKRRCKWGETRDE